MLSLADFRAATLSLSVTRDGGGLEDEFELLMQLFRTYFNWLSCWWWPAPPDLKEYWISASPLFPCSHRQAKRRIDYRSYCTQCDVANTKDAPTDPVRVLRTSKMTRRSSMDVNQGAEHLVRRANNVGAGLSQKKGLA